jgi:hypothetical protein
MSGGLGGDVGRTARRHQVPLRDIVGTRVRVVARRGYVVDGRCLDAWPLVNGGWAIKIKPVDGSAPREITTLEPVQLVQEPSATAS